MASKLSDIIEFTYSNTKYKIKREEFRFSTLYFKNCTKTKRRENVSDMEMKKPFFNPYESVIFREYILEIYLKDKEQPIIFFESVDEEKTDEECKKILLQIEQLF